jgi:acyl dehydratase
VRSHVGKEPGVSDWLEVTRETISRFADLTGDDQRIHLDVERAKQTPLGGTIAHGYFVLSLAPRFSSDMFTFDGFGFGLSYGLNRVRFPPPVPVGGRVRMRASLVAVEEIPGRGAELTFERQGAMSRCAWLSRWRACTSARGARLRHRRTAAPRARPA